MKTEDIKKMALALESVKGKKLDPVGKHDKDIDNDGDHDKTDKYLINRRKKISSSISKDKANTEVQVQESEELDELSQDTLMNYHAKAGAERQKLKAKVQAGWKKKKPSAASIKATGDAYAKFAKRGRGMTMAANKMKEETEYLEETSRKLKTISKKEYDNIESQHYSHGNRSALARTPKGEMQYKGAHHYYSDKKTNQHVSQVYSHPDHGHPTIEKRTHNDTKKVTYHKYVNESVRNFDESVNPSEYSTHGVKSQFGGYRAEIKHKTKGHTMYSGGHTYKSAAHAKGEADAYLKGYSSSGETTANAHARKHAETHAVKGPFAKKSVKEETQLDELSKKTLGSYINKSAMRLAVKSNHAGEIEARHEPSPGARATLKRLQRKNINSLVGIDRATKRLTKEEVEDLEELSRDTVRSYIRKAVPDNRERKDKVMAPFKMKDMDKNIAMHKKMKAREKGIETAGKKAYDIGGKARVPAKESVELDELSKGTLKNYIKKAAPDAYFKGKDASYHAQKANNASGPFEKETRAKHRAAAAKMTAKAANRVQGISKATDRLTKEDLDEGYKENEKRWMDQLTAVTSEIADMAEKLYADHYAACEASKRISAAYAAGETPSEADREMANKKVYDIKYLIRQLEDVRDSLEMKSPSEPETKVAATSVGRYYESVNPTKEAPISIRHALAMMEDRALQTAGATEPEPIDDKLSGKERGWINVHALEIPDETNIDAATDKNKTEVEASLQRAVNYRHNDQKIGDK